MIYTVYHTCQLGIFCVKCNSCKKKFRCVKYCSFCLICKITIWTSTWKALAPGRMCLHHVFLLQDKLLFGYDLERIIDDWILMGFLVGNDFIPHLPNMHISHVSWQLVHTCMLMPCSFQQGKFTWVFETIGLGVKCFTTRIITCWILLHEHTAFSWMLLSN